MDQQTIAAGWLTLRPFTPADIPWVHEVLLDPVLQRFMQIPSPCRLEDAASHGEQMYIAGGDGGRLAEFVAEDAATATPLGRVGLRHGEPGAAEVGYWVDPRARSRGVARVDEWVGSLLRDERSDEPLPGRTGGGCPNAVEKKRNGSEQAAEDQHLQLYWQVPRCPGARSVNSGRATTKIRFDFGLVTPTMNPSRMARSGRIGAACAASSPVIDRRCRIAWTPR